MKCDSHNAAEYSSQGWPKTDQEFLPPEHSALHLVNSHDLKQMELALRGGNVPTDFECKLKRLASQSLLHRSVEHNCRLFIGLLQAAGAGSFRRATDGERERLLRVLAYVRKDDDAIPDYKPGGFTDDQREIRSAAVELHALIQSFKAWRLRHQVPALWPDHVDRARPMPL